MTELKTILIQGNYLRKQWLNLNKGICGENLINLGPASGRANLPPWSKYNERWQPYSLEIYGNPGCYSFIRRNSETLWNSSGLGFNFKIEFLKYSRGYVFINEKPSMFYTLSKPNTIKVSVSGIGGSLSRIPIDNL